MDFAFKQYIDYNQDYDGKAVYNAPFWIPSAVDGLGVNSVDIILDKNELRTFILIHKWMLSISGIGVPITFFDSRFPTLPFFTLNNLIPVVDSVQPFEYVTKGNSFRMICSDPAVRFALLVQTVTQEKIRK